MFLNGLLPFLVWIIVSCILVQILNTRSPQNHPFPISICANGLEEIEPSFRSSDRWQHRFCHVPGQAQILNPTKLCRLLSTAAPASFSGCGCSLVVGMRALLTSAAVCLARNLAAHARPPPSMRSGRGCPSARGARRPRRGRPRAARACDLRRPPSPPACGFQPSLRSTHRSLDRAGHRGHVKGSEFPFSPLLGRRRKRSCGRVEAPNPSSNVVLVL